MAVFLAAAGALVVGSAAGETARLRSMPLKVHGLGATVKESDVPSRCSRC